MTKTDTLVIVINNLTNIYRENGRYILYSILLDKPYELYIK